MGVGGGFPAARAGTGESARASMRGRFGRRAEAILGVWGGVGADGARGGDRRRVDEEGVIEHVAGGVRRPGDSVRAVSAYPIACRSFWLTLFSETCTIACRSTRAFTPRSTGRRPRWSSRRSARTLSKRVRNGTSTRSNSAHSGAPAAKATGAHPRCHRRRL